MNARKRFCGGPAVAALNIVALCVLSATGAFAADPGKEALVVGISHYDDSQIAANDKATDNDVKLMKESLEKRGFHVHVITNNHATRQDILDALKSYPGPVDQFVFYYAGKSESDVFNGKSWIYPWDTDTKAVGTWLSARELRSAVEAVPATSRTIILDTAAAGYLMNTPAQKWVCYCVSSEVRQGAAVGQFGKDDELNKIASQISIDNQLASSFLGKEPAGVFTHYLSLELKHGSRDETWNQLMDTVATGMQHQVGANQAPDLTPDFVGSRVFSIGPDLLTRSPTQNPAPPVRIASTAARVAPPTVAPVAPPTADPVAPAPVEPPAATPAKTFDADASKKLVALWTGADGNPDEDKGRAMLASAVQAALKAGADPDTADGAGLSLLIIAAGTNRADIAKLALAAHADINFKNDGLGTALVEAAYTGSVDVVKVLLDAGADITATKDGGVTALGAAKSDYDGKTPETITKITALLTARGATN